MRSILVKLAVLLCIAVQAVWGATYRPGLLLCVPIGFHGHDRCGAACENRCGHSPVEVPGTARVPCQDGEPPCCVDILMPSSGLPDRGADLAGAACGDGLAPIAAALLPEPAILPSQAWLCVRHHPPDGAARRVCEGVGTTRLLI